MAVIPALYRGLTAVLGPLGGVVLRRRVRRGKEDPARLGERLGRAGAVRPDRPLVWLHAASVGESLSVLPLIDRFAETRPDLAILITSGTVTSAGLLAERLPAGTVHQYVPIDRPDAVRRFLDHWRPDLAVWVESELWPNLIGETQRRGIASALIQGRMSDRSFARWRYARGLIGPLLGGFDVVLVQTAADADRFGALGAGGPRVTGTLKYAASPLPADPDALHELESAIGGRPVWLAASVHPGEFAAVVAAHRHLQDKIGDPLTVAVPRHPARADQLADAATAAGIPTARRSRGEPPVSPVGFYVADTMGELGLFYRSAKVAFIGGSLIDHGGQNLIEPMQIGCPVVYGPSMYNFAEVVSDLEAAGAGAQVDRAADLAEVIGDLLADPDRRAARATAQQAVAMSKASVLDAVTAALTPLLPKG